MSGLWQRSGSCRTSRVDNVDYLPDAGPGWPPTPSSQLQEQRLTSQQADRVRLKQLSDERAAKWPNTLMAVRAKKLKDREERAEREEERRKEIGALSQPHARGPCGAGAGASLAASPPACGVFRRQGGGAVSGDEAPGAD